MMKAHVLLTIAPSLCTFKADQARTGFVPDGPRPPLKLRWKFQSRAVKADIESFFSFSVDDGFSPASIHDGVVYAGGHDGWIYAIDAKTGRKIRDHKTGGHIMTTPQYRDGRVFAGSMDGYFRVLDAKDGVAYVHVRDAQIYALDARDGRPLTR